MVNNGTLLLGSGEAFSYDPASGRLLTASDGSGETASYSYKPNTELVSTISIGSGGGTPVVHNKTWDGLNRLSSIGTSYGGQTLYSSAWTYDPVTGWRTQATQNDNTYWIYGYDNKGEVTSGTKFLQGGTALDGYSFGYTYDEVGNRTQTTVNGRVANYVPNLLNQYTQRDVPGAIDLLGTVDPSTATNVTAGLAGETVGDFPLDAVEAVKQGGNFHSTVPVTNSTGPQFPSLSIQAIKVGGGPNSTDIQKTLPTSAGHVYVAQTPEQFTYDADGNLTQDGRWTYTWDGENRLIAMETIASAVTAGVARTRLELAYDSHSRRMQKVVRTGWNGSTYVNATTTRFLYDAGWNLVAEVDAVGNSIRSYLWGLDASGTFQDAGGIGGLLVEVSGGLHLVPAFDGGGNVNLIVNAITGGVIAQQAYGPFGELVTATHGTTGFGPLQFSSKYADLETGLSYYGFGRYYKPATGRWLSRDPIQEGGGINLFGFVSNSPTQNLDYLGLSCRCECVDKVKLMPYVDDKGTGKNGKPRGGQIGWTISLIYPTCDQSGQSKGNPGTLKYEENTNIPAIAGTSAGVTYDAYEKVPNDPAFDPWNKRKFVRYKNFDNLDDQFNLIDTATIDPVLIAQANVKERITKITLRVSSAPGCRCMRATAQHTVEQHIYRFPSMTDTSILIDLGGDD